MQPLKLCAKTDSVIDPVISDACQIESELNCGRMQNLQKCFIVVTIKKGWDSGAAVVRTARHPLLPTGTYHRQWDHMVASISVSTCANISFHLQIDYQSSIRSSNQAPIKI